MARQSLAEHNAVAAFRDLELASDALGRLRGAGFEDDELSILGQKPEDLEVTPEREVGEPLAGGEGVLKHSLAGGAIGGGIGTLIGAAGGAAAAAIPGVGWAVGVGALIGAISGGLGGSTIGTFVEGEQAMASDAGLRTTIESIKEGAVVIGVHTDDADRAGEAERILRELDPMQVVRVNEQGERIDSHNDRG